MTRRPAEVSVVDRTALTALYLDEVRQRGLRASDLLGDLPGLKPFYYEGRYLSRPLFIGYSECRQLYTDVENVRTALISLPGRLYDGDFAAFAEAAGAYGAVAAVLTGQHTPSQLARADLYASQTGFQLLEINHSSANGGADNVDMCRALLRHPVLAEFARAHGLAHSGRRSRVAGRFDSPRARTTVRSVSSCPCDLRFSNSSYPTRGCHHPGAGARGRLRAERIATMPMSELSYKSADGTKIAAYRWGPELTTVVSTVFKGETLRSMLLNAYGWWKISQLTYIAAITSLTLGGVVLLGSLLSHLGDAADSFGYRFELAGECPAHHGRVGSAEHITVRAVELDQR
jgi:hypothetical protein